MMNKMQLGQLLHANNLDMEEYIKQMDEESFEVNGFDVNYYRHDVERYIRSERGEEAILEVE